MSGQQQVPVTLAVDTAADLQAPGVQLILRSFPRGAIIVFDTSLRFLSAGGRGLADTGLSSAMLEGRTAAEVFPPDVVDEITPLYRAALAGEQSEIDVEYGGRILLQQLGPVFDSAGTVVAGMGFSQDVTAVRRSQAELREESRRLQDAESIGRVGSWELDLRDQAVTWSAGIFRLYGLNPDEFDGNYSAALHIIHPDDQPHVNAAIEDCAANGTPARFRYRITRANDGELRWIESRGEAQYDDGHRIRIVGAIADVTDHVVAEAQSRTSQAFHQAVIDASPDIIFVYDLVTGSTTWSNRSLVEALGYRPTDSGSPDSGSADRFIPAEERPQFAAALAAAADAPPGEVITVDHRLTAADGTDRWFSRRMSALRRDDAGRVVELVGVLRDTSEAVAAEQHLRHSALHDNLTGLPNRALLMDRLDGALTRSERTHREVAVLFCDLDGFKRVNDTGGHAVGDQLLTEVARRLKAVLRDADTVARIGGDEFVVIIEPWNRGGGDNVGTVDQDRAAAIGIADRVRQCVRRPITVSGTEHIVSVSVGVAFGRRGDADQGTTITGDRLLQAADDAMYRAKRRGRDRCELFHSSMRADSAERSRVETVLRRALTSAQSGDDSVPTAWPGLTAAYQPIFSAATGSLVGFEALARLVDGQGVTIAPDVFIAIAEDTGIIGALDVCVLNMACRQLESWRAQDPRMQAVTMSVNVSALHAHHDVLAQEVRQALDECHLAPTDLVLELTETALLDAAVSTITTLRALHEEGVGIAIDDFGTGYASLRYLATLPISALKIDRSFTAGLPDDQVCRKIVNAVAGLAADLGLSCVVEGVETSAQRDALPDGVRLQGYLTGRPRHPAATDLGLWLDPSQP